MRRLLRVSLWIAAVYLVLSTAVAAYLVHGTLHPGRRVLPAEAEAEARRVASGLQSQLRDVQVEAPDHVTLRAWYIQPEHGNGEAVILFHGLSDNRMGTIGYAELLLRHGYAVLMPDARAHGLSGGDLATYGVVERYDIQRWFEWLERTSHPHCIYGLGESMGAAQLLQAVEVEPGFCAVVAESSFSDFREIAYDRMGQQFGAGPWVGRTVLRPIVEIALLMTRYEYHLDLTNASPIDAVAKTRVPVLLIHGRVDSNIPVRHSRMIRAQNSDVQLWEVPGADHCGAISVAPAELEERVISWFVTHQSAGTAVQVRAVAAR